VADFDANVVAVADFDADVVVVLVAVAVADSVADVVANVVTAVLRVYIVCLGPSLTLLFIIYFLFFKSEFFSVLLC
jgi:hypothetical protein